MAPLGTDGQSARRARRAHVAALYMGGQTMREVAAKLGISQGTVANDLHALELVRGAKPHRKRPNEGCPACRDPDRHARHRPAEGCARVETRRDLVVDAYVRLQLTERAVAKRLGISHRTVHVDLVARSVTRRPQARGLNRGPVSDGQLDALQEGHRHYRADVDRAKAKLLDVGELLERLRRAGLPRSLSAVCLYVRAGLIEPERDLGFDKPWLFTDASVAALITRLQEYPDDRLTRWNPTTPEKARWRADMIGKLHGARGGL